MELITQVGRGETYGVVGGIGGVTEESGDFGHGLDGDCALDGKIRLVRQAACEVIR